jgi:hypothetical protein
MLNERYEQSIHMNEGRGNKQLTDRLRTEYDMYLHEERANEFSIILKIFLI